LRYWCRTHSKITVFISSRIALIIKEIFIELSFHFLNCYTNSPLSYLRYLIPRIHCFERVNFIMSGIFLFRSIQLKLIHDISNLVLKLLVAFGCFSLRI